MLWRRVESATGKLVEREAEKDLKGLNTAIQIHVKDGVLIVPDASSGACYLITDEEFPIVSGIGHDLSHCCARSCPGLDGGLHSHGSTDG